jgi:Protein of unknown function (DUF1353)
MANFGRWLSKPEVTFDPDGITIILLKALKFLGPDNVCWVAPKDARGDGASIPRIFHSIVGSPLTGKYRDASIIHDWYCSTRTRTWETVHRVFFNAMVCSDVPMRKAKLMYAAVRYFGPKWSDMDVRNTNVLRDLKIKDYKMIDRSIGHEIEDCSGKPPLKPKNWKSDEDFVPFAITNQSQITYFYPHRNELEDRDWLVNQFDADDEAVDLDTIDKMIDARVRDYVEEEESGGGFLTR